MSYFRILGREFEKDNLGHQLHIIAISSKLLRQTASSDDSNQLDYDESQSDSAHQKYVTLNEGFKFLETTI